MFKNKIKRSFDEHKEMYIAFGVGALVGIGFALGQRYQTVLINNNLRNVAMFKKVVNPMFPNTMPIGEIKEILTQIEGAEFFDALVTNVNGVQSIIVR